MSKPYLNRNGQLVTEIKLPNGKSRRRVQEVNKEPSLTQQHMSAECDINNIMKRYNQTGYLNASSRMPSYGDFTSAGDYQESLNLVIQANDAFNALSADVRKQFKNDPSLFMSFMSDDANYDKAVELGLVDREILAARANEKLSTETLKNLNDFAKSNLSSKPTNDSNNKAIT